MVLKIFRMRKNFVNIIKKFFYLIVFFVIILMLHYGLNVKIIAKFSLLSIDHSSLNISVRYGKISTLINHDNYGDLIHRDLGFHLLNLNFTSHFLVENFNLFIKNKFSNSISFPNIYNDRIKTETAISKVVSLITKAPNHNKTEQNVKKLCRMIPNNLIGPIKINETVNVEFEELEKKYSKHDLYLNIDGHFIPKYCVPHTKVALIIPYRNRLEHLKVFLNNMHTFLRKQMVEYTIYVVEEVPLLPFNRALLMNIGYAEAIKDNDFSCFVFHDVDLLPLDDRNFYFCPTYPRHMSVNINTFDFILPYKEILGGVTAISRNHFEKINGFSNLYFGWGGEDDDFSERVISNGLKITRYPDYISRYHMLGHNKDKPSSERHNLLEKAKQRFKTDGLNSLKYKVLNKTNNSLYRTVLVSFDVPKQLIKTSS